MVITPLSPTEVKKFLCGFRKYRDLAIIHLMLFCGLRSCEILNLKTGDIDLIDDFIRVRGKGDKERILPIGQGVRLALMRYLDFERPDGPHHSCFVALKGPKRGQPLTMAGLRRLFRYHRNTSSVPKARAHQFRHTFATHMIREGVSLPVVCKLMGHCDIELTMAYVHMSPEDVSKEYHQAIKALQKSHEKI
jgi:site-specific recombinase XerD